jgi:hypothetical protein
MNTILVKASAVMQADAATLTLINLREDRHVRPLSSELTTALPHLFCAK